jgi:hypothetical protein
MHGARRRVRLVMAAVLLGSLIPAASVAPAGATAPTDPLDLAISHVRDNAAEFGLGGTDVAELTVTSQVKSKHNGVTHVNLNQNYRGLEVFGANGTVNISADFGSITNGVCQLERSLSIVELVTKSQLSPRSVDFTKPPFWYSA